MAINYNAFRIEAQARQKKYTVSNFRPLRRDDAPLEPEAPRESFTDRIIRQYAESLGQTVEEFYAKNAKSAKSAE